MKSNWECGNDAFGLSQICWETWLMDQFAERTSG